MNWEVEKTYKTRGGWEAVVLSTGGTEAEPLIVKHKYPRSESVECHTLDGSFFSGDNAGSPAEHDLITE